MPDLAYLNGQIIRIEDAFISIEDRGYQFGDAVYEFIESFDFHIFCLDEHLKRLQTSMAQLDFPPVAISDLKDGIINLFNLSEYKKAGCYLQISRGVEPRTHSYTNMVSPQITMTIKNLAHIDSSVNTKGIKIRTCEDYRWGMCHVKTVQLLPAALEQHRAKKAGLADTVFVSEDGYVRESTCTNIFMVKNNTLITHPLDNHILPGITRDVIINRICKKENIEVHERYYHINELYNGDEGFLCSTVMKIQPVIEVDGKKIGKGEPGPLTKKIQTFYDQLLYH
ncbi:MAG: aminotransferase class IV [Desulfobacula sp.]|jgi:D-alanine transaminase